MLVVTLVIPFEPIEFLIDGIFVRFPLLLEPGTFPEDVGGICSSSFAFWVGADVRIRFPSVLESMRSAYASSHDSLDSSTISGLQLAGGTKFVSIRVLITLGVLVAV